MVPHVVVAPLAVIVADCSPALTIKLFVLAKEVLAGIPEAVDTATQSDELRGAFEGVRALIEQVKQEIRGAYEAIRKAMESLKSLHIETASTTPVQ